MMWSEIKWWEMLKERDEVCRIDRLGYMRHRLTMAHANSVTPISEHTARLFGVSLGETVTYYVDYYTDFSNN